MTIPLTMTYNFSIMHIVVYGVGAIGGFYGALLERASKRSGAHQISFLARGNTYEKLKKDGLTLTVNHAGLKPDNFKEGEHGDENLREIFELRNGDYYEIIKEKVNVFDDYAQIKNPDVVLLCTKSKDTRAAAEDIKRNLSDKTYVVSVQNGVTNEEVIAEVLGKERVMGCLTNIASQVLEPAEILKSGTYSIIIGELDKTKSDRLLNLEKVLAEGDVNAKVTEDIQYEQWRKLVWNTGFNPISALHELEVGPLLRNSDYKKTIEGIMNETIEIAHAQGIMIPDDTTKKWIDRSSVPEWEHFKTSMLQDMLRKRPIELEEILGVIIVKGKELNIATPFAESVYKPLKKKVERMFSKA